MRRLPRQGLRVHGDHPFVEMAWPDVVTTLTEGPARMRDGSASMAAIAASVIDHHRTDVIAAVLKSHDSELWVVPKPIPAPPYALVVVHGRPSEGSTGVGGSVTIEEHALTGLGDVVERPKDEAVALFWRFMIEKFGIGPSAI